MKGFLIGQYTDILAQEYTEITTKKGQEKDSWLEFDTTYDQIAKLTYRSQSAEFLGILLQEANNIDELTAAIDLTVFDKVKTFRVNAYKFDPEKKHPDTIQTTVDIAQQIGERISHEAKKQKLDWSVKMEGADIEFCVVLRSNKVLLGVDLVGFELTKRPYKIFAHPSSVNGMVGYLAARLTGVKKDSTILDPFCDCATIPIELALWQNNSSPFLFERKFIGLQNPHSKKAFEKAEKAIKEQPIKEKDIFAFEPQLRVMLQAKKNIKLANVSVQCSKVNVDWLDTKFEEDDVDYIVSKPPQISKRNTAKKQIEKTYDEFFYQARFVLKKQGRIGLIMHQVDHILPFAQKHQFQKEQVLSIYGGKQEFKLLILKKND